MLQTIVVISIVATVIVLITAIRKQGRVTQSFSENEQSVNTRVFEESSRRMEAAVQASVAERLAEQARDPRLANMTQEDLVIEVLKDCYDPEIPLNVVDLGLIYSVKVHPDNVDLKITMTSPMCPSHAAISEDIKAKLSDAGFPEARIELVWEPAWSPQRISEAGRKALGI